jgi:hypothetical protein
MSRLKVETYIMYFVGVEGIVIQIPPYRQSSNLSSYVWWTGGRKSVPFFTAQELYLLRLAYCPVKKDRGGSWQGYASHE